MRTIAIVSTGMFLLLLLLVITGIVARRIPADSHVEGTLLKGKPSGTMYVSVHGLWTRRSPTNWVNVEKVLLQEGDVLPIRYPAGYLANGDPEAISAAIKSKVDESYRSGNYRQVIMVGNSMGALLARRAWLTSLNDGQASWAANTARLVLMAGMNRGWDLSGEKPADMHWYDHAVATSVAWFARLTYSGRLLMSMESGAPFVANLRLDWMRAMRKPNKLEVVQMLGDIDEVVSTEDNQDLRVMSSNGQGNNSFVWMKVRGTGHAQITHFASGKDDPTKLGAYRRKKFETAIRADIADLLRESEELPFEIDPSVEEIVFVLHGIRDLGRWSAKFEEEIKTQAKQWKTGKVAIASSRYGYFGMGQFLLRADRERYVHWFMDQYTETLARYPNAKRVHFMGHSNGTYLLGRALEKYEAMRVDNVVLAGSVMRRDYDWLKLVEAGRVKTVRNYVAIDDWVVALFPALFEKPLVRLLGNDIGSAGFNGFANLSPDGKVDNVGYLTGNHSAFDKVVPDIVEDLLGPPRQRKVHGVQHPVKVLKIASDYLIPVLWLSLAWIVVLVGHRVSVAAGELSMFALLAYVVLVINVLRWV